MTDSVFDIALEKRFTDSTEITTVEVTSADMLLIRDSETGNIFKMSVATLTSAVNSALSGSQIISKLGYTPENAANKGSANGYAGLDSGGKIPSSQLPSFVDDVLEYANIGAFPATGETGKIYVSLATNLCYRWSGSAYVEISASPGSTDAVPEGATNKYYTDARARAAVSATGSLSYNPTTGIFSFNDAVTSVAGKTGAVTLAKSDVGLSNVDNTSDATKNSATATLTNKTLDSASLNGNTVNNGAFYTTTGTFTVAASGTTTFDVTGLESAKRYLVGCYCSGANMVLNALGVVITGDSGNIIANVVTLISGDYWQGSIAIQTYNALGAFSYSAGNGNKFQFVMTGDGVADRTATYFVLKLF